MTNTQSDFQLALPARAENVAVIRHLLGGVADAVDIPPDVLHDIRLAVSEACANVVVHAYADAPHDGTLEIAVRLGEPRKLEVVVRDHGRGMKPRPDSPGLGVGLPLIAALSTALELGTGDDGSTEVHMTFDLDDRESSSPSDGTVAA